MICRICRNFFRCDLRGKFVHIVISGARISVRVGGRLVFGVENGTWQVKGYSKEEVFLKMDAITNAIYDSCEPKITPDIGIQEIDGKSIIVVNIIPGMQKPYYIQRQGPIDGVYVRVAGTTRHADSRVTRKRKDCPDWQ